MMNLRTSSNQDGFEKFLTKLCVAPSGWESMLPILYNAHWLFIQCGEIEKPWPTIDNPKVFETKTGAKVRDGLFSGEWDNSGDLTYTRRLLASFGIWGMKNITSEEIGALTP